MKHLLIFYLLVTPFVSTSQIRDTSFAQINENLNKAAEEMIKFHSQFQLGTGLEILGGVVIGVCSLKNTPIHNTQPFLIGASIISFIGFLTVISSTYHIKAAGIYLKGNSLVVPIHNRKPITIFKNKRI